MADSGAPAALRRGPPLNRFTVSGAVGTALLAAAPLAPALLGQEAASTGVTTATVPLAGAAATVALWLFARPPYAVAGGVVVAATLGGGSVPVAGALAAAGGLGILLADVARRTDLGSAIVALASAATLLGGTVAAALAAGASLLAAGAALVLAGATLIYATHRYELVRMGLVDGE